MDTYEKKYEEALELARKFREHLLEDNNEDYAEEIECIFPELKESKDEKIRKELIKHIDSNSNSGFILFRKFPPNEIIDWLNRQVKSEEKYSVWVGGLEMNDHYLTQREARKLAKEYREEGYSDVRIELIDC